MANSFVVDSPTVLVSGRTSSLRLEASYVRAFDEMGCNAFLFEAESDDGDLSWWIRNRVGRRLTRFSLRLRAWGGRQRNEALIRRAGELKPDLLLLVKGQFIMPTTVSSLNDVADSVAVLHPDAPFPGNPSYRPEQLPVSRETDVTFIWSRQLQARLERQGASSVVYLPFAWDPDVFPYVKDTKGGGPEVIFVGGWDPLREEWLEPVADHFKLEIWGPKYWRTRTKLGSPLRDCWQGRALRGPEAARAVARADIALNILREQNLPDGTNMRTFEVPGAGGFLLATRTDGAMEIYPEDQAGAYFATMSELLEKIGYYLEHVEEREAISRSAHEITAREHRYMHRVQRILKSTGVAVE